MRLTTQTDYALRTLMYLAARPGRATVMQVADLYGISANHVAKVVNQLARIGLVRSVRGIGGGIELARSAGDIRLGEVIEAFEGNMHLLDCVHIEDVCVIQPFCKLKNILATAERIQMEYLNSLTLLDVIPRARELNAVADPPRPS